MKNGKKVAIGVGTMAGLGALIYLATRVEAKPPPPPGRANLYGKVTDAITGIPIGGVLVSLNGLEVSTNTGGNYIFEDLDPGAYLLQFTKEGYETAVY